MIQILKASAGSGKTFRLALEYIRLLLENSETDAFRHILAVTFTNKATAEMKSRILTELDLLASDPTESDYYKFFVPKLFPTPELLSRKASICLAAILHDYSAFAVSTIDRFFQQTLKAFSREIGHFASYQIELDEEALIRESVDRILDSLGDKDHPGDRKLIQWLTDSVLTGLENGERFNLDAQLDNIALQLKSDRYRNLLREKGLEETKILDKDHLLRIFKCCKDIIQRFEEQVRDHSQAFMDLAATKGIALEEFYSTFRAAIPLFIKESTTPGATVSYPKDAFFKRAGDPETWFLKAVYKRESDFSAFQPHLDALVALFERPYQIYRTATILRGQLYNLGIAAELKKEFEALMQEKNILTISDSNTLLNEIIDGSDAPFVYERIGVRYLHFLLDEFQDTSTIQWDNFRPLIANSDATDQDNLIVGDIKQSIYRWRESDWHLLDRRVNNDFPSARTESMQDNWRTLPRVVSVNNDFFLYAAAQLDLQLGDPDHTIFRIYSDVCQVAKKGEPDEGCVEAVFCPDTDAEMDEIVAAIRDCRSRNGEYGDIAILVRGNGEATSIANRLISEKIPVISDEALHVKSSLTVRRLVSLLWLMNAPAKEREEGRSVPGFMARELSIPLPEAWHNLPDLAEKLLKEIQAADPDTFSSEIAHIEAFMDYLQERISINGNDIAAFLADWKDADPRVNPPEEGSSVRIMTIHKAKGLEFPFVILPFLEKIDFSRTEETWSVPDVSGSELEGIADGAYRVVLSKQSTNTLFRDSYEEERRLQMIDNINILYVGMTRPCCELRIIAKPPTENQQTSLPKEGPGAFVRHWKENEEWNLDAPLMNWSRMNQLVYSYTAAEDTGFQPVPGEEAVQRFRFGEPFDFKKRKRKEKTTPLPAAYPSFALKGRLRFSDDAADFFGPEGSTGFEASPRVMGTVLHNILSQVIYPETDLAPAVEQAVRSGELPAGRAQEIRDVLAERINDIRRKQPDWFPAPDSGYRVLNETSLMSAEGEIVRPDRVVFSPDGRRATIVDYKFGKKNPGTAEADRELRGYLRQIGLYASLLRDMGYPEVSASLWYPLAPESEAVVTLPPKA